MSDGQFWGALSVVFLGVNAVVASFVGEGHKGLGCLVVPVGCSLAITAYVLLFDRDPQAPIFLLMFYVTAAVSGAMGSVVGQVIRKRLR